MASQSECVKVVTAVNDDYVLPLAVTLNSAMCSLSGESHLDVKVLTLGLSRESRGTLERSASGAGMEVEVIKVDPSPLEGLKVTGHISRETYLRLLAPHYLDADKVLYLDGDLVVRHSIRGIYQQS